MKKQKHSTKIKIPLLTYVNTNCPLTGDVNDFLDAVKRFRKKKGPKPYQKNRDCADLLVRRLLTKHHVIGTISSRFWYMEAMNILVAKTPEQVAKEMKMLREVAKKAGK